MSFAAISPEAYIPRSDSKNPASTCRALTTSGRPCRRDIGRNASVSTDAASFYCWQHKHLASLPTSPRRHAAPSPSRPAPDTTCAPEMRHRTSVDTLISRLGSLRLAPSASEVPSAAIRQRTQPQPQPRPRRRSSNRSGLGFWAQLCCARRQDDVDEDSSSPDSTAARNVGPRGSTRHETYSQRRHVTEPPSRTPQTTTSSRPDHPVHLHSSDSHSRAPSTPNQARPSNPFAPLPPSSPHSQDLIPPHLPVATRAALSAELAKPPSPHDVPGYIYVFRLSPTPSPSRPGPAPTPDSPPPTILLKIGRATNVHRRLTQWHRQCGREPRLLRWYPYVSTAALASPGVLYSPDSAPASPASAVSPSTLR